MLAGEFVVMKLIVFGVEQMNPGIGGMKAADLFLQGDELIPFLGIAGNGNATDGKFDAQLRFDRGCDDGVITEDLFGLVGVGRLAAHADAGVSIVRELGTAETECIGRFPDERGNGNSMNVGLWKYQRQPEFSKWFLDAEEFEVVAVGGGKVFGGVFEGEGKDRNLGAFDVLREARIRAFGSDAALFAGNDLSGILDPVEDTVVDFLHDIVDSNRCARIVEVTAAAVTGSGRKQGSVGGLDVVAQEAELLNQGNEGVEDFLITALAKTPSEVRECGTARDGIVNYSGKGPIGLTQPGIAQDRAEVFDVGDLVEIAEEVENEQRDGIVAGSADNGVGIGGDGADEREIDDGSDEVRESAADGTVVVDMDPLRMELIMGEPAGFFLGKRFGVCEVNRGIDFLELCDYIVNRELGEINHLISSRVSRETVLPSNRLSRNPFLFSGQFRQQPHWQVFLSHRDDSSSSGSMKAGSCASRSCVAA